tara:strand:+ start:786 stop:1163 length:378 start_codon:yes stop_codon:yes gene_type:complete
MDYLIIAAVSVWAVEVFLKLPVRTAVAELWRVSQKAIHTVMSPHISDHWKEKVMLAYACKSLASTLKLAALVIGFVALVMLPVVVLDYFPATEEPLLPLFASTQGLLASTAVAVCYFWVRGLFAK